MTATITPNLTVTLTREQARVLTENGPDEDGGWCIDCRVYKPTIATGICGEPRLCPSCALKWTEHEQFGKPQFAAVDAAVVAGLNRLAARLALRKARTGWSGRPSLDDPHGGSGWVGCEWDDARYGWNADW